VCPDFVHHAPTCFPAWKTFLLQRRGVGRYHRHPSWIHHLCANTPEGRDVNVNRVCSDGRARDIFQEHYVRRRASCLRDHLHLYPRKSPPSHLVPRLTGYSQGFGLTIGSEFYLLFNESAATNTDGLAVTRSIEYLTGRFVPLNASMTGAGANQTGFGVSLEIALPPDEAMHMIKGRCCPGRARR